MNDPMNTGYRCDCGDPCCARCYGSAAAAANRRQDAVLDICERLHSEAYAKVRAAAPNPDKPGMALSELRAHAEALANLDAETLHDGIAWGELEALFVAVGALDEALTAAVECRTTEERAEDELSEREAY